MKKISIPTPIGPCPFLVGSKVKAIYPAHWSNLGEIATVMASNFPHSSLYIRVKWDNPKIHPQSTSGFYWTRFGPVSAVEEVEHCFSPKRVLSTEVITAHMNSVYVTQTLPGNYHLRTVDPGEYHGRGFFLCPSLDWAIVRDTENRQILVARKKGD